LVLQYETVVANPVAAMEDVLDHAGLDRDGYDFASLLSNNVPNNSSFGSGAGTGFVDGEGINTGSIGRFRSVLDARVGRFVDFLCSDINAAYGYEAISSRQDWEPQFADLLRALDKGCRRARISMAAVQNRLSAAGIDPRRFG
jgi:hypothetical protein